MPDGKILLIDDDEKLAEGLALFAKKPGRGEGYVFVRKNKAEAA